LNSFRTSLHSPLLRKAALGLYAGLYLVFGIYPEVISPLQKLNPGPIFGDFQIYLRALNDALTGVNPYAVRAIEVAYFYPPPSLLIFEVFRLIQPFYVQIILLSVLNIALMIWMIHGLASQYGYSLKQTWSWYGLCLVFAPFLEALRMGQITMIVLFGLFLLFYFEERSPVLSGIGLGLAVITKLTPVLFFAYLLVRKRFKVLTVSLAVIVLLTGLSVLRYGLGPILEYPDMVQWLLSRMSLDVNSQSLVAKLSLQNFTYIQQTLPVFPQFILGPLESFASFITAHAQLVQRLLMLYTVLAILASGAFTFVGKQPREPMFMITVLGMLLSSNIVWYHHYMYILLPLLMWMAWTKMDRRVVIWCLAGLLIIEIDRRLLTYGLLAQLFGQVSLLMILISQAKKFFSERRSRRMETPALAQA